VAESDTLIVQIIKESRKADPSGAVYLTCHRQTMVVQPRRLTDVFVLGPDEFEHANYRA
jgi:hypothetical protein